MMARLNSSRGRMAGRMACRAGFSNDCASAVQNTTAYRNGTEMKPVAMATSTEAEASMGTVCASSVLPKWRTVTYGPANMFDGRLDTAWVEGVDGVGAGERITLMFDSERFVSGISFLNGYHKSNDLFQKNGRITAIDVATSSGEQLTAEVADDPGEQVRTFDRPARLKWITISIASAVAGTKYTDTAISEMRVLFE